MALERKGNRMKDTGERRKGIKGSKSNSVLHPDRGEASCRARKGEREHEAGGYQTDVEQSR